MGSKLCRYFIGQRVGVNRGYHLLSRVTQGVTVEHKQDKNIS